MLSSAVHFISFFRYAFKNSEPAYYQRPVEQYQPEPVDYYKPKPVEYYQPKPVEYVPTKPVYVAPEPVEYFQPKYTRSLHQVSRRALKDPYDPRYI